MIARALRQAFLLLLAAGLVACTPDLPAPGTVNEAAPRRAWEPDTEPRAVLLAVHGFNDYSQAFEGFGTFAQRHGVAVHAYDQRGFGARPDAGQWPGVRALATDLRRELARLADLYPDAPLYVLGESMGAAVILVAASAQPLPVEGIVLSAPAIWGGDTLNPFYRATLWLAVRVVPMLTLTGRSLDIMASDNIEMLRALGRDPLVIKETRVDAIAGLVGLMDRALEASAAVPGPLLVLAGERDEIVPPAAQDALRERLNASPCAEVLYPEGYHMLLRDLQRQVVWRDVLAWIDDRPLPSGLGRPCGDRLMSASASPR